MTAPSSMARVVETARLGCIEGAEVDVAAAA
jgi:hypothetical protein